MLLGVGEGATGDGDSGANGIVREGVRVIGISAVGIGVARPLEPLTVIISSFVIAVDVSTRP